MLEAARFFPFSLGVWLLTDGEKSLSLAAGFFSFGVKFFFSREIFISCVEEFIPWGGIFITCGEEFISCDVIFIS